VFEAEEGCVEGDEKESGSREGKRKWLKRTHPRKRDIGIGIDIDIPVPENKYFRSSPFSDDDHETKYAVQMLSKFAEIFIF
jgi:hypothetical protein